jgi:hypothetical protein
MAVLERMRRASSAQLWVVIEEPGGEPRSWVSRSTRHVHSVLRSHPEVFQELEWHGELGDGCRVHLFSRIGDLDKLAQLPDVQSRATK